MDQNTQPTQSKGSIFTNKWFRVVAFIIGIVMLISGLVKIFGSGETRVSQEFIDKYNEIGALSSEISSAKSLSDMLIDLPAKDTAKDYNGAAKSVTDAIAQLNNWASKTSAIKNLLVELKNLSGSIADAETKQSALNMIDLLNQRADLFSQILSDQSSVLISTRNYYADLSAGRKAVPPNDQIAALNKKLDTKLVTMNELIVKIKTAQDNFAKLAGLTDAGTK